MKDITGIKLASKKLRESEERYKSFMKNFRAIAFHGDMDFIPILVDGSVKEITGYLGDDFISGKEMHLDVNETFLGIDTAIPGDNY